MQLSFVINGGFLLNTKSIVVCVVGRIHSPSFTREGILKQTSLSQTYFVLEKSCNFSSWHGFWRLRSWKITRVRSLRVRLRHAPVKHVTYLLTYLWSFTFILQFSLFSPVCAIFRHHVISILGNLRRRWAWLNNEWSNQIILTHCACVNFSI